MCSAEYIYSRNEDPQRTICWPTIQDVARQAGPRVRQPQRVLGRAQLHAATSRKVKAASLIAHGNNDNNVMTKNAAQFYEALKAQGVPHQFYFHQGGHGGAPPDFLLNLWFTKYLWGQDNGVENLPKSWVVRARPAPARRARRRSSATSRTRRR